MKDSREQIVRGAMKAGAVALSRARPRVEIPENVPLPLSSSAPRPRSLEESLGLGTTVKTPDQPLSSPLAAAEGEREMTEKQVLALEIIGFVKEMQSHLASLAS